MGIPAIAVIGDIMIDITKFCTVDRLSPEAPVPVCKLQSTKYTLGGAGNVAANLAHLLPNTRIILVGWMNLFDEKLFNKLSLPKNLIIYSPMDQKPVAKKRVIDIKSGYQMIRIDDDVPLKPLPISWTLGILNDFDLRAVVFSDYCKGTLACTDLITSILDELTCITFLDTKDDDISRYRYVDYITPNINEFKKLCLSYKFSNYEQFLQDIGIDNLIITRGENGVSMYCLSKNESGDEVVDFHLPATTNQVIDVTGAGDTLLAGFVASLIGEGKDPFVALEVANLLAGEVCKKRGSALPDSTLPNACKAVESHEDGN